MTAEQEYTVTQLMAMTPSELHANADTLPALRGWFDLTETQQARVIQHVRTKLRSTPISLSAVNEKLLRSRSATPQTRQRSHSVEIFSSQSTTPEPPTREEHFQEILRTELDAYRALVADGGRPTHDPQNMTRRILRNPYDHSTIISYWARSNPADRRILLHQKRRWDEFRRYQDRERADGKFLQHAQRVSRHFKERHGDTNISLQQDRSLQSSMSDWKERLYWERQCANKYSRSVKAAERGFEAEKAQFRAAENDQTSSDKTILGLRAKCFYGEERLERQRYLAEQHMFLLRWVEDQISEIASGVLQNATEGLGPSPLNNRARPCEKSPLSVSEEDARASAVVLTPAKRKRVEDSPLSNPRPKRTRTMRQDYSHPTSERMRSKTSEQVPSLTAKNGRNSRTEAAKTTWDGRDWNEKSKQFSAQQGGQTVIGHRRQNGKVGRSSSSVGKRRSRTHALGEFGGHGSDRAIRVSQASSHRCELRRSARIAEKGKSRLLMA